MSITVIVIICFRVNIYIYISLTETKHNAYLIHKRPHLTGMSLFSFLPKEVWIPRILNFSPWAQSTWHKPLENEWELLEGRREDIYMLCIPSSIHFIRATKREEPAEMYSFIYTVYLDSTLDV